MELCCLPVVPSAHLILSPFFSRFLLPSDFRLSRLLSPFFILPPQTFVIPLLFSAFFPSAQIFHSPNFSFSFFFSFLSRSNLVSLSVRQDKLSEEVQKQHDGPGENGSPPATQTEPDAGLPPNADPDASQAEAEEDKDTTKPLLERLKALEVTTPLPPHFSFLPLSLMPSFCFPALHLPLFLFTPASSSSLPATPGYPLWPACLASCQSPSLHLRLKA